MPCVPLELAFKCHLLDISV